MGSPTFRLPFGNSWPMVTLSSHSSAWWELTTARSFGSPAGYRRGRRDARDWAAVAWTIVYVDTLRDGRVVEHASGDGWLDLLIAIGALPPPG
jgi:hypothetical protein